MSSNITKIKKHPKKTKTRQVTSWYCSFRAATTASVCCRAFCAAWRAAWPAVLAASAPLEAALLSSCMAVMKKNGDAGRPMVV